MCARAALYATAEDLGVADRDDTYGYRLFRAKFAIDNLLTGTRMPTLNLTSAPPSVMYTVPITNMVLNTGLTNHYYIDVTHGQTILCSTNGQNGDADLYMCFGERAVPDEFFIGNACKSLSSTSNESCSNIAALVSMKVYVAVYAYTSFSGFSFQCTVTTPVAKMYTVPITNMVLNTGLTNHYYIDVTRGQTISCSTNGPSGDADLYMNFGELAVPDEFFTGYACKSLSSASNELCSNIAALVSTKVYVAVYGYTSFSDLTFQCVLEMITPKPTLRPSTSKPTLRPSTSKPTRRPWTRKPSTSKPSTRKPSTRKPSTCKLSTRKPII